MSDNDQANTLRLDAYTKIQEMMATEDSAHRFGEIVRCIVYNCEDEIEKLEGNDK